jgi:glutaminyl-peptide cyclotransferase
MMKKPFFLLVLILGIFVFLLSCSSQNKRSRKPVSTITINPTAQNYIYGNTISVRVQTKLRNGDIDNVKLFFRGNLLHETDELDFTVNNIKLDEIGTHLFNVTATKTDGVNNTRQVSINVLSDVTPKKYTFNTVRDFPHNTGYYTQGFEFHNGYIYEGTGEYGSSGLYKYNLRSGQVAMSHKLNNKYFGEGITILDDKIYQLTYREQKGFIYNLDDFSVADSFEYRSKEGWGLTNDGKNLIMSNGTQELIWLDPVDFSEIRKVQVANHIGIVNYLNELEYINKTIYANVYTTNMIVQIEPETGKVLSEINLTGILNMYKNPADTVDYLNGIAYDHDSDRLFVTGKWWPRIFEIKLVESK